MPRTDEPLDLDDDYEDDRPRKKDRRISEDADLRKVGGAPVWVWSLLAVGGLVVVGCAVGLGVFLGRAGKPEKGFAVAADKREGATQRVAGGEAPAALLPEQPKGSAELAKPKSEFQDEFGAFQVEYHDNELSADSKYLNKYGYITIKVIVEIGKKDGIPYLSTHNFAHSPAPNGYFLFAADQGPELAKIKLGYEHKVKVFGKCIGKKRDHINRGISGFDFQVDFVDCRVVEITPGLKYWTDGSPKKK